MNATELETVHLKSLAHLHVKVTVVTVDGDYYTDQTIGGADNDTVRFTGPRDDAHSFARPSILAVITQQEISQFVTPDGSPSPTVHYGNGRTYLPECTDGVFADRQPDCTRLATHMVNGGSYCAACAAGEIEGRKAEEARHAAWMAEWMAEHADELAAEARHAAWMAEWMAEHADELAAEARAVGTAPFG